MVMRKFLFAAIAAVVCVLCVGAVFAASDVAYAANGDYYIHIAPTDESLLANAEPSLSQIAVTVSMSETSPVFYLQESYYYKVYDFFGYRENESICQIAVNGDTNNLFACIVNNSLLVPKAQVPASAETAGVPDVRLTVAVGKSVSDTENNVIPAGNGDYVLRFVGFNGGNVFFSAQKGENLTFGTAPKDSFTAFSLPYSESYAARKAELEKASQPSDEGNADLTGGTESKTLRIILIIGITVPALIIVILLFKPTGENKRGYDKRALKHDSSQRIDYDRERNYSSDRDRYDRGYRDYERRDYPERRDYDRGYDRDYDRRYDRDYDRRDRGYPRDYDDR